eukprot:667615-Prorocentrum_minimum.AAC.10
MGFEIQRGKSSTPSVSSWISCNCNGSPVTSAVTLLRFYAFTLLRFYAVTLLRCYAVTLLRCYAVTLDT